MQVKHTVFAIISIIVSLVLQTNGEVTTDGNVPENNEIFKEENESKRTLKLPFRKCCNFGQAFYLNTDNCTDKDMFMALNQYEDPIVRQKTNLGHSNMETLQNSEDYQFMIKKINCSRFENLSQFFVLPSFRFNLVDNGNLHVENEKGSVEIYGPDKYCIDDFVWTDVTNTNDIHYQLNALICFPDTPETESKKIYTVSSTCMLISCFFIILTVAVYAWLPELRNLHGMVLMAYLISFFVGFVFLASLQILILQNQNAFEICISFSFIIYFSFLTAFFWMNVMCYDIWRTFSGTRAMSGSRKATERHRFLCYCMYAFGVPTLLTILMAVLEYSVDPNKSLLLPRLRLQGSFLNGKSKLLYLYAPIVVLCVANLAFFALTARNIAEIKKGTKMLNKKDKQRFSLYIKLFIVMGVNWILEVVSSLWPEASYIWRFTDAYNVLVGLIFFIIFVCKKKTLKKIKDRFKGCRGSNSNIGAMEDISSKGFRWQNNQGVKASIDTIRTTLGMDSDSKSIKSEKINNITKT